MFSVRNVSTSIAVLGLLISLLALFAGCSSTADGTSEAAITKCDDWSSVYCDRVLACGSPLTRKQCLDALATSLDCGRAVSVSASFDRCLSELQTFDCAVFDDGNTLPASCTKAILAK